MSVIINKIDLIQTRSGSLTLKIKGEDGAVKTIHSMYDPEAEAKTIAGSFEFNGKGMLIVLGLGLGYHVAELAKRFPDAEVIVVEALPEIHELAKEHGPEVSGDVQYLVGLTPSEALRQIAKLQMRDGIRPLSVFSLSAEVSAFPDYYRPILDALNKTVSVKLWDRLRYAKFKLDKYKVLLIDTGYFLVREAEKALKSLGHGVLRVPVDTKGNGEAIISRFMEAIVDFKPDFMLTMNHLAFDEDGVLTQFFRSIEMPVASWYVDSPKLIVHAFDKNVSPWISLFLWDRTYIEDMRLMGFEWVDYLPLGTDADLFKPLKQHSKLKNHNSKYSCDIGFVGNSMVGPVEEWMSKTYKEYHPLIDRAAGCLSHSEESFSSLIENLRGEDRTLYDRLTGKQRTDFEAAVLWKATMLYRLSCIKKLDGFDLHIHGDGGWKNLLNSREVKLYPPLNYYSELPLFYNACRINFNATSLQMRQAVNQRVFDVPACGAFILTDYQKGMDELFTVGEEVVVYKDKDEIYDLVKFYLGNQSARDVIAGKARERVLKEHTYRHRLDVMVRSMKERYA